MGYEIQDLTRKKLQKYDKEPSRGEIESTLYVGQPRMMDADEYKAVGGKETCPNATLSTTNPT
jgi:hypothetical protein